MANRDPYEVLGVPEDASAETVRTVYRQLARTFHPDVNADPEAVEHFREITEAFLTLSDEEKRHACDRERRVRSRACGEQTDMYIGLQVAGIDLGGLLGVSVTVRRRPLFDEPPAGDPPRAALRARKR